MSNQETLQELAITLPGMDRDAVHVERAAGREALGQAYEYTVDVISRDPLSLEPMVGKATKLEIRVLDEVAVTFGVVASVQSHDPTQKREFCYRFVIVPEFALLKYSAQNQVYGTDKDVTVVDIIENELNDANKAGSSTGSSRAARTIQFEMLADKSAYSKLDFVLQYRESDFDFICRMCEKFGLFFAFDHSGTRESILFYDRKEHFRKLCGRSLDENLPFRGSAQTRSTGEFAVRSFNAVYSVQSGSVHMREYNDETPNVGLSVSENTSFAGQGVRVDYGQNYRTAPEGQFLAKRRAEQLETERLQFRGESNIPLIRPGLFFKLVDHPISDFETLYVVIEVEHWIVQQTPLGFSTPDKQSQPYSNRFVCVPFDTSYRPPLRTPKPVINGFLIAFIDGEGDGKRAELDTYGRYRVRILDEESGLSGGKASYVMRKAEPYGGGDGSGSHSTLLVGTEVLLSFQHGDPDRPMIVGALSNAEKSNPVTDSNNNVAYRTRTASGVIHQICDGA
ncbi:type VI secretion system Vgr family protein [Mesorhizobium sp. PL10]